MGSLSLSLLSIESKKKLLSFFFFLFLNSLWPIKKLQPSTTLLTLSYAETVCVDYSLISCNAVVTYNVVSFGADPSAKSDSSSSFQGAWEAACISTLPAEVYVPPGRYLLGIPLVFSCKYKYKCKCKCKCRARKRMTTIRIHGTLVAPSNYSVMGNAGNWLNFNQVSGVSIVGDGIIDAQGETLWDCKASHSRPCPPGATSLMFNNSKNIVIDGLTSRHSQKFHIVVSGCDNVTLRRLTVMAEGNSPNTDGIHVQNSTSVTILSSSIRTGDDCISIGPGSTKLRIQTISCGPGHGISIGSLGWKEKEAGVQDVKVDAVTFAGTSNGVRIKTWGRPSSSFVKNVVFRNATMLNVQNPIIIDQNYCPNRQGCPRRASGVQISNVTYKDILGSSKKKVAIKFNCSPTNPCGGIVLDHVRLTYQNQSAGASCANAFGKVSNDSLVPLDCLQN